MGVVLNICMSVYVHTHTHLFFPFSGQPCISDNEDMREVDLPEREADSGCPPPALPENGFIWVSVLTITFGLRFKRRTRNVWVFFLLELLFSYLRICCLKSTKGYPRNAGTPFDRDVPGVSSCQLVSQGRAR